MQSDMSRRGAVRSSWIAEDRFKTLEGNRADRMDLHIRQLYAFAMRHHPDLPPDPQKVKRAAKPRARADPALLRSAAREITAREITASETTDVGLIIHDSGSY
jgi:hypothetical protein